MDIIAAPLISMVCSFCNSIAKNVKLFFKVDRRILSLKTALKELKDKRDDLKSQVEEAELKGLARTSQVQGWMERVAEVESEASSIAEDPGCRTRCFGCCSCSDCSSKYEVSKRVLALLSEINELIGKGGFENFANRQLPVPVVEMASRPAVGISLMLDKVWGFLAEEDTGTIGIFGMGGVGKTTLLRIINNECLAKSYFFDVVIWVVVSRDFAARTIQQAIEARLGLPSEESQSLEQRASEIYRVMRRKMFLLLLDDVWEGVDLQKIGIPLPDKDNKGKVIFTTRSLDVCSDMDAQQTLKMEFLGDEDSWQLFCSKVGRSGVLESHHIRPYAKMIVKKCGGLPLALITIAKAMANKESKEEWKYAVEVLNKSPSEVRGMEDVFTLLKFSYDNLENDALRSCLLYCSLFPEDYSIEKEQLIEYWIGEGFLNSSHDIHVYNRGHDLIRSLKVACLLETGEESTQVKMHDVVRSFALWVASECGSNKRLVLVEAGMGVCEAPRAKKWEEARRISLLDNGITELVEIPRCPKLSTLLLQWNNGLNKIPTSFFQFMPVLRVLDLSFTSLREVPASINLLAELRHLDLSGTKIAALPKELGDLKKLKHLDLQRTRSLRVIPRHAIAGLQKLQVLNLYYGYEAWEENNSESHEDVDFADLLCLKHLRSLGVTVNELKTLKKLYNFNSLLRLIQYFYIKECEGLFYLRLPSNADFGERLRRISINNCYDLKYLQVDEEAGDNWLPNLEVLALHGLPNLATVWRNPVSRECLQNLRNVNIWHCHKLKNVSWVSQLPKLEVIYLMYCAEIEEVASVTAVGDSKAFPSLRTLSIRELPNLRSITQRELVFPSLERIAVIECPKLKKLLIRSHNTSSLPTVYGNKLWWDSLEWDDDTTKSAFLSHFMSI